MAQSEQEILAGLADIVNEETGLEVRVGRPLPEARYLLLTKAGLPGEKVVRYWAATVTGGVFTGQSSVTMARDRLYGAVSDPVAGQSPSGIGINTTKDGDITFDAAAFAAAYAKDPGGVTTALQTITGRVAAAAASVSDPVNGTLTQRIQGGQKTIDSLNSQISDWDGRLAAKRTTLQAQYNSMEVQLGKLQSQQSWLNSQLDALSANGKSSK